MKNIWRMQFDFDKIEYNFCDSENMVAIATASHVSEWS